MTQAPINLQAIEAAKIRIAECEQALGYTLSSGEKRDLIADNFQWPLPQIKLIVAACEGTLQ